MATQLIFGQVSCHEYGFDALMALTFLPITAGTILLFLLTGQRFKNPPLRDHALDQVELGISQDAMDLLRKMFRFGSNDRLSLEEVTNHPWTRSQLVHLS